MIYRGVWLTKREVEDLNQIVSGELQKSVAQEDGTTVQAVKNRRWILYKKIGVRNRIEAAIWWLWPLGRERRDDDSR